jgi:AraC-like DNA-binding protein
MSVSVVVVRGLLEAAARAHVDSGALLSAACWDPARLDQVEARIPQAEYEALVELALDLTGDPALGLHMGGAARALESILAAQVVLRAKSLRESMKLAAQFHRLHTGERPFVVEEGSGATIVRIVGATGSLRCRRFSAEVAAAGIFQLVQHFAPGRLPNFVVFEHAAPSHREEYARIFRGTERFEQSFTGLVLAPDLMDARQPTVDGALHSVLWGEACTRLAQLDHVASYHDKVREYVTTVPERAHDLSSVARALGMRPRSLRKRLLEEGVTFRDVVAEALASIAMRLLAEEGKSIQEAAHEMSFSEASAFCRAFKRWTGSTPKEYQFLKGARGRAMIQSKGASGTTLPGA